MKVLFVQPVPPRRLWPRGIFRSMHIPTGIAYIASALQRAGHEVKVHIREEQFYKCREHWDATDAALLNLLREFRPDMVGLSVLTPSVPETAQIAAQAKKICGHDTITVAGGVHPTALGREMLDAIPELDIVVVGEGEQTIVEVAARTTLSTVAGIIYRQNDACAQTAPRSPVQNLDQLAPIDYGMFDMAYYTAPSPWLIRWLELPAINLRTSRGCTNRCRFCAGHLVSGLGVRFHSLDFVVEQMQMSLERFHVRGIHFEDDTLGADANRLVSLCQAIRRKGLQKQLCWDGCLRVNQATPELLAEMKAAGCVQIEYGFESASDEALRRLGKGATNAMNRQAVEITRKAGLRIYADIMIGLPGETAADLGGTREFLRWAAPEVVSFGTLGVLPGSALFDGLPESVRRSLDYADYAYFEQTHGMNLTAMSAAQFAQASRNFTRYFIKPWVYRQLLRDASAENNVFRRQLQRHLRGFLWRHPIRYARLPR